MPLAIIKQIKLLLEPGQSNLARIRPVDRTHAAIAGSEFINKSIARSSIAPGDNGRVEGSHWWSLLIALTQLLQLIQQDRHDEAIQESYRSTNSRSSSGNQPDFHV